jgi:hypothetical protein
MKKLTLGGLVVAAIATLSATAFAYVDTEYFTIGRINAPTGSSDGYHIYPGEGYALPTQGNCAKYDFAEVMPGLFASDRDMIHRTVLAAFMAGRKVKLRLDGCGATGRPAYRIVALNSGM